MSYAARHGPTTPGRRAGREASTTKSPAATSRRQVTTPLCAASNTREKNPLSASHCWICGRVCVRPGWTSMPELLRSEVTGALFMRLTICTTCAPACDVPPDVPTKELRRRFHQSPVTAERSNAFLDFVREYKMMAEVAGLDHQDRMLKERRETGRVSEDAPLVMPLSLAVVIARELLEVLNAAYDSGNLHGNELTIVREEQLALRLLVQRVERREAHSLMGSAKPRSQQPTAASVGKSRDDFDPTPSRTVPVVSPGPSSRRTTQSTTLRAPTASSTPRSGKPPRASSPKRSAAAVAASSPPRRPFFFDPDDWETSAKENTKTGNEHTFPLRLAGGGGGAASSPSKRSQQRPAGNPTNASLSPAVWLKESRAVLAEAEKRAAQSRQQMTPERTTPAATPLRLAAPMAESIPASPLRRSTTSSPIRSPPSSPRAASPTQQQRRATAIQPATSAQGASPKASPAQSPVTPREPPVSPAGDTARVRALEARVKAAEERYDSMASGFEKQQQQWAESRSGLEKRVQELEAALERSHTATIEAQRAAAEERRINKGPSVASWQNAVVRSQLESFEKLAQARLDAAGTLWAKKASLVVDKAVAISGASSRRAADNDRLKAELMTAQEGLRRERDDVDASRKTVMRAWTDTAMALQGGVADVSPFASFTVSGALPAQPGTPPPAGGGTSDAWQERVRRYNNLEEQSAATPKQQTGRQVDRAAVRTRTATTIF